MGRHPKSLNVAIATETRAEYWLLRPIYRAVERQGGLRATFLASGMHHLACFGRTLDAIRADRVRLRLLPTAATGDADSPAARGRAVSRAVAAYARELTRFDWLVILGDRLEMLAAAVAATALGKPVAHLHGGDVAPGARDDAIRHAVTKLAHLHFPATTQAARRIRRLGEPAWRIHLAGAPGIDAIRQTALPDKTRLDELTDWDTGQPFAVVLQHAAGFSPRQEEVYLRQTLSAVADFFDRVVVIGPGLDVGSSRLHGAIRRFVSARRPAGRWKFLPSLDQADYFGLLGRARLLAGNSSSGIIESASFKLPVVDVGPRQQGRQASTNVIHCEYGRSSVAAAIRTALEDRDFARRLARCRNLYGDGRAGQIVARAIAATPIDRRLMVKRIDY